jgi:hypothetical protein
LLIYKRYTDRFTSETIMIEITEREREREREREGENNGKRTSKN